MDLLGDTVPQSKDLLRYSDTISKEGCVQLICSEEARLISLVSLRPGTPRVLPANGKFWTSGDLLAHSALDGLSARGTSSLSKEAETLEQRDRLLSLLRLRDKVDSKLDSPEECSISANRIRFFFGGSFSVGSLDKLSLLWGQLKVSGGFSGSVP